MAHLQFENVGWKRTAYARADLDRVQQEIVEAGYFVREWDIGPFAEEFGEYIKLPEYGGSYRVYGGQDVCSFLEKALEHFVSLKITHPVGGQVFMDVGSCVSVVPEVLRRYYGCDCYVQDLELPSGVHDWSVGSNAAQIPLSNGSLNAMTLHCTYEHFEGEADSQFVGECARLLKPGGKAVILPLYVNLHWTNITGETEEAVRQRISFDGEASYWCVIPEWRNRFGRHYSVKAVCHRVLDVAAGLGLKVQMFRVVNFEQVHPGLWLKWILVLEKPFEPASPTTGAIHQPLGCCR